MSIDATIATYRDARDAVMTAERILDRAHRDLVDAARAADIVAADLPDDIREDL